MPTSQSERVNRSAEWRKWRKHYRALGCSERKVNKLTFRRLGIR
jgi:hypothetical protein